MGVRARTWPTYVASADSAVSKRGIRCNGDQSAHAVRFYILFSALSFSLCVCVVMGLYLPCSMYRSRWSSYPIIRYFEALSACSRLFCVRCIMRLCMASTHTRLVSLHNMGVMGVLWSFGYRSVLSLASGPAQRKGYLVSLSVVCAADVSWHMKSTSVSTCTG